MFYQISLYLFSYWNTYFFISSERWKVKCFYHFFFFVLQIFCEDVLYRKVLFIGFTLGISAIESRWRMCACLVCPIYNLFIFTWFYLFKDFDKYYYFTIFFLIMLSRYLSIILNISVYFSYNILWSVAVLLLMFIVVQMSLFH